MTDELIPIYAWAMKRRLSWDEVRELIYKFGMPFVMKGNIEHLREDVALPIGNEEKIVCQVCGRLFRKLTASHLQQHGYTLDRYRNEFKNAPLTSQKEREAGGARRRGRTHSDASRQKISQNRSGIKPLNHRRHLVGAYTCSDETKAKMAASHTGLLHSEETKQKIGNAHRGRTIPADRVEASRQSLLKRYREGSFVQPMKGKQHSEKTKEVYRAAAKKREAAYTAEQREQLGKVRSVSLKGIKRTAEQKERYRAARVKFMMENPQKTKDTAGERMIKLWLEERGIRYHQQFVIPGTSHPYDFYLPDTNTLVEFDGTHHWAFFWFNISGKSDDEIAQMLENQKIKDAEENWVAGRAGFRIVRVYGYAAPGDSEHGDLETQLREQGFPGL